MNKRPNILIVCTDQQRTDTLSCYGTDFLKTPGFDRIASDGTRYTRAYCNSALCTPSRVSMLSGQYVNRHKVWSIGTNTGSDVPMLQHYLGSAGYRTALIGKAHLEAYTAPREQSSESVKGYEKGYGDWNGPYYGFDDVRLALGHGHYGMTGHYGAWLRTQYSEDEITAFKSIRPQSNALPFGCEAYRSTMPTKHHNSVWTVDSAIDYFDGHDDEDPFFMFLSFQDPHHPHILPEDFELTIDADQVPLPNYVEGELQDKPPHFSLARTGELPGSRFTGRRYPMSGQEQGHDYRQVSDDSAREGRQYYYSMVSLIDTQLQRLWVELEKRGLYENTLIIVTSDHGELLGDHGIWMKGPFHYEPLVRVPLLVKPAHSDETTKGLVQQSVTSLVDIVPTCLKAAGIDDCTTRFDGVALSDTSDTSDRHVLVETVQEWDSLACKTLVSDRHKMTWYADEAFGELYDLANDPDERINLWEDPASCALKSQLLARILDLEVHAGESKKERISYA